LLPDNRQDFVMRKARALNFVRRCIYNRWFYGFLGLVCVLDLLTEVLDLLQPGVNPVLDAASLVLSGLAAALALAIFFDLHLRQGKP
jgi:hypothetical protein